MKLRAQHQIYYPLEDDIFRIQSGTIVSRAGIPLESAAYGQSVLSVVLQSEIGSNVAGEASERVVDLH